MCVSMLVGTTFAWFTDTASTGVNKIQAGTLDVQLLDEQGNTLEGQTLSWKKAAGHENEAVLWEPGCTYNLQSFKIKNNGNLALKYKIVISGIVGDAKLLEAIDFTVTGVDGVTTANALNGFEGKLAASSMTDAITISGHMKEYAGNEYQGKSIDGIGITVVATQDTVEHDSNGNTYDERAEYPVLASSVSDFRDALSQGNSTIILASDVTVEDGIQMSVENDASINFNGNTLKGAVESGSISSSDGPTKLVLSDPNNSDEYSIDGELVQHAGGGYTQLAAITVWKPTVTIESGKYTYDNAVILCQLQTQDSDAVGVVVNGGTCNVDGGGSLIQVSSGNASDYLTITGGTFNVNPSEYVDTANYNVTHSGSTWTVTAK